MRGGKNYDSSLYKFHLSYYEILKGNILCVNVLVKVQFQKKTQLNIGKGSVFNIFTSVVQIYSNQTFFAAVDRGPFA